MTIRYPGKAARLKDKSGKELPRKMCSRSGFGSGRGLSVITPKLSSNLPIFGNQRVDYIAPCNSAATVPEIKLTSTVRSVNTSSDGANTTTRGYGKDRQTTFGQAAANARDRNIHCPRTCYSDRAITPYERCQRVKSCHF